MDWYPLLNSLRIAAISTAITICLGVFAAYKIDKLPTAVKGITDVVLTLPLVLPPTVIGFFILKATGPFSPIGAWALRIWDVKLVMNWYSAIFATVIVTFPLMYRTARGAFAAFDMNLKYAAQTLGKSNTWAFWRITLPNCKMGITAGAILAFARALGEYGATNMVAGYTPGRTATIATTVYQLWRTGNDALAYRWVGINILISCVVLISINFFEKNQKNGKNRKWVLKEE